MECNPQVPKGGQTLWYNKLNVLEMRTAGKLAEVIRKFAGEQPELDKECKLIQQCKSSC